MMKFGGCKALEKLGSCSEGKGWTTESSANGRGDPKEGKIRARHVWKYFSLRIFFVPITLQRYHVSIFGTT